MKHTLQLGPLNVWSVTKTVRTMLSRKFSPRGISEIIPEDTRYLKTIGVTNFYMDFREGRPLVGLIIILQMTVTATIMPEQLNLNQDPPRLQTLLLDPAIFLNIFPVRICSLVLPRPKT